MTKRISLSLLATVGALICTGCGRAPSFDILGSFFPGWLACIAVGVSLTIVIRSLLIHFQLRQSLRLLPLVYLSLTVLFACSFWLLCFE